MLEIDFRNINELKEWLKQKNFEAGSPEEYNEWLCNFFEEGHTISVHGENFDYWACLELL